MQNSWSDLYHSLGVTQWKRRKAKYIILPISSLHKSACIQAGNLRGDPKEERAENAGTVTAAAASVHHSSLRVWRNESTVSLHSGG